MAEKTETLIDEGGSTSNTTITIGSTNGQYSFRIHLGARELVNVLVTQAELKALLREINPAVIRYGRELTIGFDIGTDMFAFHFNVGAVRVKRLLDSLTFESMIGDFVYLDSCA